MANGSHVDNVWEVSPVGGIFNMLMVPADAGYKIAQDAGKEFEIYDFNNMQSLYGDSLQKILGDGIDLTVDTVTLLNGTQRIAYAPKEVRNMGKLVEGIGWDTQRGAYASDLISPCCLVPTATLHKNYGLAAVYEQGQLVYKGQNYADYESMTRETYKPLVREGVVWSYYLNFRNNNPSGPDDPLASCDTLYHITLAGDTLIGGVSYKKCFRYGGKAVGAGAVPVCFLREAERKVYVISNRANVNDPIVNAYPVGVGANATYENSGEMLLYDFVNGDSINDIYYAGDTTLNGVALSKFNVEGWGIEVESIGYDGRSGDLVAIACDFPTFSPHNCRLVSVTEGGVEIYRGCGYADYQKGHDAITAPTVAQGAISQTGNAVQVTCTSGTVTVVDLAGRVALSRKVSGSAAISLQGLQPGAYVVVLATPAGHFTQKVLVK